ncbi:Methylthioribulose-1-phosphate dehydratase [Drechslerella dactyloides]|uniref:Methylthioribulose-1-phosphate dehydratase n=1 Tax=Drechslerella dactyloides TaxID=74499 RepID=A0AAD6ITN5_DREDA|nr:Methylthioribulose-1-phosphate dehydratase [Drechslerella dactyloides]
MVSPTSPAVPAAAGTLLSGNYFITSKRTGQKVSRVPREDRSLTPKKVALLSPGQEAAAFELEKNPDQTYRINHKGSIVVSMNGQLFAWLAEHPPLPEYTDTWSIIPTSERNVFYVREASPIRPPGAYWTVPAGATQVAVQPLTEGEMPDFNPAAFRVAQASMSALTLATELTPSPIAPYARQTLISSTESHYHALRHDIRTSTSKSPPSPIAAFLAYVYPPYSKTKMSMAENPVLSEEEQTALVTSDDPHHPANLILYKGELCRNFYTLGWVTGTGGGISIKQEYPLSPSPSPSPLLLHPHAHNTDVSNGISDNIYIAPSGVQKERLHPHDMFILNHSTKSYLRHPTPLKPSACTPLFLAAYAKGAGACIHTHSHWAVLATLICRGKKTFRIANAEMIKGIPCPSEKRYYGFHDTLEIPIIENTAKEEDLRESLEKAIQEYPSGGTACKYTHTHHINTDTNGSRYVWGDTVWKAKTQAECYDYLFQLAVEMAKLGLDPAGPIEPVDE